MDPVTLIVSALAAGAREAFKDGATSAIKSAYAALSARVKDRLSARPDAGLILERHETAPAAWQGPLAAELEAAGVDAHLVAAAQAVLLLLDPAGSRAGKYAVNVHGSQGVQVGDHNVQHNTFGSPPVPPAPGSRSRRS
jgi:hypothetical protein